MECELAPTSPEDAPALARVAARTLSEAWSEVGLREALEQAGCRALAARDAGGSVRGFVLGRRVLTESRSSNRSTQALYERLGFVIQGQRPGFYGDGEHALLVGVVL